MLKSLNLVPSESGKIEKRVFPRYPLNHLTFRIKEDSERALSTFEVVDISLSGMQVEKKIGDQDFKRGDHIQGIISWYGQKCDIFGVVKWSKGNRIGVLFDESPLAQEKIQGFLNIDHFIQNLKPLHDKKFGISKPQELHYWLRADGPLELFVWSYNGGQEIAKFQIIMFRDFVEWEDNLGNKSGTVLTRRDLETPLFTEDEFAFQLDSKLDGQKLKRAEKFIQKIPRSYLDPEVHAFLLRKIK